MRLTARGRSAGKFDTVENNYARMGIVADPNRNAKVKVSIGYNMPGEAISSSDEEESEAESEDEDESEGRGKRAKRPRRASAAEEAEEPAADAEELYPFEEAAKEDDDPTRGYHLAEGNIDFIAKMIAKHGTDYTAMSRDVKLNYNQHTKKQLKKRCEAYAKRVAELRAEASE